MKPTFTWTIKKIKPIIIRTDGIGVTSSEIPMQLIS